MTIHPKQIITHLCNITLAKSNLVASVEINVVICPVECFALALFESRRDLRKMSEMTPARMDMPFVMVRIVYWFVARDDISGGDAQI